MKKLIVIFLIVSGVFLYPFGCEGQTQINGTLDGNGGYTFEQDLKRSVDSLQLVITDYKNQVQDLVKSVADKDQAIDQKQVELAAALLIAANLKADIVDLNNQIAAQAAAGEAQQAKIANLNSQVAAEKAASEQLQVKITDLQDQVAVQVAAAAADQVKLKDLNDQIAVIESQVILKDKEIASLKQSLAEKPATVTDTIYQEKIVEVVPGIKIDTFTTISDPILLDFTDSLVQPTDIADVYVMVIGIGLVHLQQVDTIYSFQRHYTIERTVDYAETRNQPTTYKNLGLPFQARQWYVVPGSITSTSANIRVLATDQCKIQYNLNGKAPAHAASSEDFNATKISDIEFRHTRLLDNLAPGTDYFLQITIVNQQGHIDVVDLTFKTLE